MTFLEPKVWNITCSLPGKLCGDLARLKSEPPLWHGKYWIQAPESEQESNVVVHPTALAVKHDQSA